MTCSSCGREVAGNANFCRHCGAAQSVGPPPAAHAPATDAPGTAIGESAASADSAEQLRTAVAALQAQVGYLTDRVAALENAQSGQSAQPSVISNAPVGLSESPAPAPAAPVLPSGPPVPTEYYAPAAMAPPPLDVTGAYATGAVSPPRNDFPGLAFLNWEWLIGGNWLARIGILALIIGVGFFLKLAFDNDWIGEAGRVFLGLGVGAALLGGGEFWQRKYPAWAQAVTGGGIAILYLSIYAAFALYELIPAWPALGFSLLVTLTAAGLALRYEARAIAVLGILGGFATPLFLADKLPQQEALLAYVMLLDLGVLALAAFRSWRWFTLLALVGSLVLFLFWQGELDPPLAVAQIGITVIFLIFVAATTMFHLIWRRPPQAFDQVLIVLNATAYLGISYWLLWEDFRVWMGGFTLLLAAFYGLLAYGILMRHREQVNLSMFALGVALVLLSIAVPVQLDGPWIAPAWAVQGTVLVWLSFLIRMPQLRGFSVVAFVVAFGWLLAGDFLWNLFDSYVFGNRIAGEMPVLNVRFLSHCIMIAAAYVAAFLWWRGRDELSIEPERFAPAAFVVAANLVTLWSLSLQVVVAVQLAADNGNLSPFIVDNLVSLSLSGLWAVYAAVLIVLGIVKEQRWLRLGGLALLAVPILKLFFYDAFQLEQGYRVAAFIGLGALLVIGGFLYQRYSRVIRGFLLE